MTIIAVVCAALIATAVWAAPDPSAVAALTEGIGHYRAGRSSDALGAFRRAVELDERLPLVYYFAARIRFENRQYNRAEDNLRAALRDSAGFTDAAGLLALVLRETGRNDEALTHWRAFLAAGNSVDPATAEVGSIMDPERYHEMVVARIRAEEERREAARRDRKAQERAERQAALEAVRQTGDPVDDEPVAVAHDTTAVTADTTLMTGPVPGPPADETAVSADALEEQIASGIRTGLAGLAVALAVLAGGGLGVYVLVRRQRRRTAPVFDEDMEHFMAEVAVERNISEPDEDTLRAEFRDKRRRIAGDEPEQPREQSPGSDTAIDTIGTDLALDRPAVADDAGPTWDVSCATDDTREPGKGPVGGAHQGEHDYRKPITEEVKALVTRMHHEGHSVEDICRAADMTRTEVSLIVAVRSTTTERLVTTALEEQTEEDVSVDTLYQAIAELSAEGGSDIDIARRLCISTGEVRFAQAVLSHIREPVQTTEKQGSEQIKRTDNDDSHEQGVKQWRTMRDWGTDT